MINKYYVGATHIAQAIQRGTNVNSTHSTIDTAIDEARRKVQTGEVDCCVVVQIVKVIHRVNPIVIEDVD